MIGKDSRFNHGGTVRYVDHNGELLEFEHLSIRPSLVRVDHTDNVFYTPSSSDSWSSIGWKLLGSAKHYWIVADYSGVVDCFSDLHGKERKEIFGTLSANLTAGVKTSITLGRTRGVKRGQALTIQDMDSLVEATTTVLDVNSETGVVSCAPFTVPGGGITAAKSRVYATVRDPLRVRAPSAQRAQFEALNFTDYTQTLEE
jgi:hypothetical protein